MLENLIRQHDSFGGKKKITTTIEMLSQVGSLPVADLHSLNIPNGTVELLKCLEIIKETKGMVELVVKDAKQSFPLLIFQLLFEKLKSERLLHEFLNEGNIHYEKKYQRIFINNTMIPLLFAALRNILMSLEFFQKDTLITSQFFIHPDFQDWFREQVIPAIEEMQLTNNPLNKLINQRTHQEELGKRAEIFVLGYERRKLKYHPNTSNIKIISHFDTSAGYDIQSYISNDSIVLDKFIEVKSYQGTPRFYWTENEIKISKIKGDRYYLYLVDRSFIDEKGYHPIKIKNPSQILFSDSDWIYRNDGYFFEKNNKN